MDDALRVQLAQGERDAHCHAQEEAEFHRRPQKPVQRFAAGVLEDQGGPALVLRERDRLSCPCGPQLARKRILVPEPLERCRRGMPG